MKKWQKLELWGIAIVLTSILLQFFVSVAIEKNMKDTDAALLELRLNSIYHYITIGEEYNPRWENIEIYTKGPSATGDNHWRFDGVYYFLGPIALMLFILGSIFGLLGRYCEYSEKNVLKEIGTVSNIN